jgi:integration host factor subunit beta
VSKTKSNLVDLVAARAKISRVHAEMMVRQVFDCMSDALQRGEGVEVRGFGTFTLRTYGAYNGRNPRTGESIHVEPKRFPFFKVGKELRERVLTVGRVAGLGGRTIDG